MLTAYRRHRADCKHRSRRYKACSCPIWAQGVLHGAPLRRSLDLTSWEAAAKKIRDLEIHGDVRVYSVAEAVKRFLADREAMKLSRAMMSKYKNVAAELTEELGELPVRSVLADDVRKLRESWKLAPVTSQKRLEMVRKFFSFCLDSDWIGKNPTKAVKSPVVNYEPIRIAHPKMPDDSPKRLLALILLMRYSGLRISDAVMFKQGTLKDGNLLVRQRKTKQPVWVPLPQKVLDALKECEMTNGYYFYAGTGKPETCVKEWGDRFKKVYIMAGIPDGHSHRLRDTFAVDLLVHNVPLEIVSILLGHASIKTTEKHYAPWIKSRQIALETAVRLTWAA